MKQNSLQHPSSWPKGKKLKSTFNINIDQQWVEKYANTISGMVSWKMTYKVEKMRLHNGRTKWHVLQLLRHFTFASNICSCVSRQTVLREFAHKLDAMLTKKEWSTKIACLHSHRETDKHINCKSHIFPGVAELLVKLGRVLHSYTWKMGHWIDLIYLGTWDTV